MTFGWTFEDVVTRTIREPVRPFLFFSPNLLCMCACVMCVCRAFFIDFLPMTRKSTSLHFLSHAEVCQSRDFFGHASRGSVRSSRGRRHAKVTSEKRSPCKPCEIEDHAALIFFFIVPLSSFESPFFLFFVLIFQIHILLSYYPITYLTQPDVENEDDDAFLS